MEVPLKKMPGAELRIMTSNIWGDYFGNPPHEREDALADFPGTILAVSHDRYFINRFADKVFVLEKDGIREYLGNYDSYFAKVSRDAEPDGDTAGMTRTALDKERKRSRAEQQRMKEQKELLKQYQLPLVSFSMNIAGPVKNGPLIRRGFRLGERTLKELLAIRKIPVLHEEITDAETGCEGLYVVPRRAVDTALQDEAEQGIVARVAGGVLKLDARKRSGQVKLQVGPLSQSVAVVASVDPRQR